MINTKKFTIKINKDCLLVDNKQYFILRLYQNQICHFKIINMSNDVSTKFYISYDPEGKFPLSFPLNKGHFTLSITNKMPKVLYYYCTNMQLGNAIIIN